MRKKKIIFFLPGGVGGAERVTITLAKMLPLDEFDVQFVIVDKSFGAIKSFIPEHYKVNYIHIRNIWDFTSLKMVRFLKKETPDLAFCSLRYLNCRLLLASKFIDGLSVIVRNDNGLKDLKFYEPFLIKLTYRWAKWIIVQQEEMKKELESKLNIDSSRLVVFNNPIDIDTISRSSKASPFSNEDKLLKKFVWTARFDYAKGQDVLVKAFSYLLKKQPDSKLYLVGAYSEQSAFFQEVKSIVHECGIESNVEFVGFDSNPYRWIANADCFVLPSRLEGLPNSLIEAMYLGIPVVAAACVPVIRRIVDDGYNGYLVDSDNPVQLSEAMVNALELHDFKMTYVPFGKNDFLRLLS